jgi:hypothetical protein
VIIGWHVAAAAERDYVFRELHNERRRRLNLTLVICLSASSRATANTKSVVVRRENGTDVPRDYSIAVTRLLLPSCRQRICADSA